MKAIITVGISASGKTTWAEKYQNQSPNNWRIISRDNYRYHILDEKSLIEDYGLEGIPWKNWNWKWEKEVTFRCQNALEYAAAQGKNIIIADTNLNFNRLMDLKESLIKEYNYEVEIKYFHVDWDEAVRRDTARSNGVGISVLAEQWEKMIKLQQDLGLADRYIPVNTRPRAVIVDVDGTLAHMNGRKPFDWSTVGEDDPDVEVMCAVWGFKESGYKIIVMSGRDGVCEAETREWLDRYMHYDELYMREAGDMRKDSIVKKELFDTYVRNLYNVRMVIDDRPQVCRMWRDLGLKVMQVGNPYIEF
jgi:predicted kinase